MQQCACFSKDGLGGLFSLDVRPGPLLLLLCLSLRRLLLPCSSPHDSRSRLTFRYNAHVLRKTL